MLPELDDLESGSKTDAKRREQMPSPFCFPAQLYIPESPNAPVLLTGCDRQTRLQRHIYAGLGLSQVCACFDIEVRPGT